LLFPTTFVSQECVSSLLLQRDPLSDGIFHNQAGVDIGTPAFNETSLSWFVDEFGKTLTAYGWQPGVDYFIAWWNWNYGPPSLNATGWFDRLEHLITETTAKIRRVVLVAHSQGNTPAYYFLTTWLEWKMPESADDWKQAHIHRYISLGNQLGGFFPGLAPTGSISPDWTEFLAFQNEAGTWAWPDYEDWGSISVLTYHDGTPAPVWDYENNWDALGLTERYWNSYTNGRSRPDGFGSTHPGVNTTVICGTGVETTYGYNLQTNTPKTTTHGDGFIPLQACHYALHWCDESYDTHQYVLQQVEHMDVLTSAISLIQWLNEALQITDLPTVDVLGLVD